MIYSIRSILFLLAGLPHVTFGDNSNHILVIIHITICWCYKSLCGNNTHHILAKIHIIFWWYYTSHYGDDTHHMSHQYLKLPVLKRYLRTDGALLGNFQQTLRILCWGHPAFSTQFGECTIMQWILMIYSSLLLLGIWNILVYKIMKIIKR